jgi:hypothetical protein
MSDQTSHRNERLKATMRDRDTDNLNKSGKEGVVPCSPRQAPNGPRTPTRHVDPYRK